MKYTDLIFDLYGTLVDIHTEESDWVWEKCASFFRENGVEIDGKALKDQYQKEIALREGKMGQEYECYPDIPFDEVMECIFDEKKNSCQQPQRKFWSVKGGGGRKTYRSRT